MKRHNDGIWLVKRKGDAWQVYSSHEIAGFQYARTQFPTLEALVWLTFYTEE